MPQVPTPGQLALLIVSIALFAIGGAVSLSRLWIEKPWSRLAAKALGWSGLIVALGVLIWHNIVRGSWLPLENNFDSLIWLALLLALFVFYVQRTRPLGGLDWFIMPIVILLLISAAVFGRTNPHEYPVGDLWSWVHRITSYGGAVAFFVAGAVGAMYLVVNRRLRRKEPLPGPNLGNLERLEHITYVSVTLGFALITIGAVTGFVQMFVAHKDTMMAKLVLTTAVWFVYAIILHSPINPSFRGRKTALLSILGVVLMIGTLLAVQLMPGPAESRTEDGGWRMEDRKTSILNSPSSILSSREGAT